MTDLGDWRYVHASVPGVAHLAGGNDCQDACGAELLSLPDIGPVLILAVADGAGSATQSRTGAELACRTLLTECATRLDLGTTDWTRTTAETLLQSIRTALMQRAAEENLPVREFACTLLGAVVTSDHALFLQIGDGAIVIDTGEGYRPVFWPQTGVYANETHFVTDPDATTHLECTALAEPIAEIALLSDGLQLLALHYQNRQAHAPFFRPLFQRLREHPEPGCPATLAAALERFLASPAINQRTHDDKTLILATRQPVPAPTAEVITVEPASAASPAGPVETDATPATEAVVAEAIDDSSAADSEVSHIAAASVRPDSATLASPVRDNNGDEAV
jgi:hypothetical protein